ncbi:crossover junction endodeoxyribonuclease RuvC [uncultured Dialister sp.]|uniref:crossover junction endodeoxyribonuclease RuvC n=1 Tax=uncultured Dialister sp. TaxID=278064 RepID=UPI0025FBE904|nr:crossover junction endodeoxyribonuclease RuvC [uncultured Dialister sp.]
MRVLGIDPGTGRCGFGVVDKVGTKITPVNYGVIETYKDQSDMERLNIVYEGIGELVARYRPRFMGVETLYFNTNITTGIKVAQARGVILLAAYRQNIPVVPVTPLQVKQQMTGYGRAGKKQVIEMVKRMMGITKKIDPDDAADALAIGLTAIYHVEHRQLFGEEMK